MILVFFYGLGSYFGPFILSSQGVACPFKKAFEFTAYEMHSAGLAIDGLVRD